MTSTQKSSGTTRLKIRSTVKAGGLITSNHSATRLKIRSTVKAGGIITQNHNAVALSL